MGTMPPTANSSDILASLLLCRLIFQDGMARHGVPHPTFIFISRCADPIQQAQNYHKNEFLSGRSLWRYAIAAVMQYG